MEKDLERIEKEKQAAYSEETNSQLTPWKCIRSPISELITFVPKMPHMQ